MPINPINVLSPKFTSPDNAVVQAIATGQNDSRVGVYADSPNNAAVYAQSTNSTAVYAEGKVAAQFTGPVQITGDTQHQGSVAVSGDLEVSGNIDVTGDIRLKGADCAEEFAVRDLESVEPGTVMVLGGDGRLEPSFCSYDKRVAGVISGAGDYRPGIVLDDGAPTAERRPLALVGKTFARWMPAMAR